MSKVVLRGEEAREAIRKGVSEVYNTVRTTLGPGGRNALVTRDWRSPRITNDGVFIAKNIDLEDECADLVAKSFIQAAAETNEKAGDGPQPLNSKILTPNGFRRMGDLKVGDEICGTDGSLQQVLGIFPKGQKEVCEIEFSDGRIVECCEDHLWTVNTSWGLQKTLTTKQMLDSVLYYEKAGRKHYKFFTPVSKADYPQKQFEIDPYLLGVLIGDGSLSQDDATEISLGMNKEHILDKILLPEGMSMNISFVEDKNYFRVKIVGKTKDGKTIRDLLENIGLQGTKSDTKFIPKEYLYSDENSRLNLLAGLSDTDGHINVRGLLEYSTVSEQLYKDFLELLHGLGRQTYSTLHKRNNDSYSDTPIFRIRELKGYKYGNKIVDIRRTGQIVEMQCIRVSNSDNLYFTDNYILTHNTTTTMTLGGRLILDTLDELDKDNNPIAASNNINLAQLRRDILKSKDNILKEIDKRTEKVETLEQLTDIATVSVEDPELGKTVAEMVWEVGTDGFIDVKEGHRGVIETEIIKGLKVSGKFAHPGFINNPNRRQIEAEDTPVVCTNYHLENPQEFADGINNLIKLGHKKIIVLAHNYKEDVLTTIAAAVKSGKVQILPLKAPSLTTEEWEDVCAVLGCNLINKDKGELFTQLDLGNLGRAQRIVATEEDIVITGGAGNAEERAKVIKEALDVERLPEFKNRMKRRIASLLAGVGIIRVGAQSEIEKGYLKLKLEDAQFACKAALQDGYVPGGGTCLKDIAKGLKEDDVLKTVLEEPYRQIAENMGVDSFKVPKNVIDPARVVKMAVENSCSVASTIVTTDSIIAERGSKKDYDALLQIAEALKK